MRIRICLFIYIISSRIIHSSTSSTIISNSFSKVMLCMVCISRQARVGGILLHLPQRLLLPLFLNSLRHTFPPHIPLPKSKPLLLQYHLRTIKLQSLQIQQPRHLNLLIQLLPANRQSLLYPPPPTQRHRPPLSQQMIHRHQRPHRIHTPRTIHILQQVAAVERVMRRMQRIMRNGTLRRRRLLLSIRNNSRVSFSNPMHHLNKKGYILYL